MPLQIYANPNLGPALYQQGSDALTMAISGAGASIGNALQQIGDRLERKREEEKRVMANAKAAQTIFQANPEIQQRLGISPEAFKALSASDQASTIQGVITELTLQQAISRARAEQEQSANAARYPAFARELSQYGQRIEDLPMALAPGEISRRTQPLDARAMFEASARTGYNPSGQADDLLRAISTGQQEMGTGPLTFDEDPVTGSRFARTGRSVLPSGINPAKAPIEAEELFDGDGNLIGHRVPIGGGKFTFRPLRPEASGELMPVLDPVTRQPVPGMGMDASGKVHDFRSVLQKSMGAPQPAAEPAAKPRGVVDTISGWFSRGGSKTNAPAPPAPPAPPAKPQAPTVPAAPAAREERIRVRKKDGTLGTIPRSQLMQALLEGYEVIE